MKEISGWLERFRNIYKPLLGSEYDGFEEALAAVKSRHVRLSISRNADYFTDLSEKAVLEPLSSYKNVYKVTSGGESVTNSVSFQTGGAYIMNPSSVVPAEILASFMPEDPIILDVSAAPGGKTCAISDYVGRRGVIIANEISSNRLKSLHFNLEKYGCYNVKTISVDGRLLNTMFKGVFNGILLDAPCSNENKIFRDKTVQAQWSKELVERMAALQRQLITAAFDCLAPGGVIVYSTCTLSIEENEGVVKHLLDTEPDATLLDAPSHRGRGLSGISAIDEKVARIIPSKESIDGFFTAVILKKGERLKGTTIIPKLTDRQKNFFSKHFKKIPDNINIIEAENRGYAETATGLFPGIRFKRRGLNIYKEAGDNLEVSAQALWEWGSEVVDDIKINVTPKEAEAYLKGFDLNLPNIYKGNVLFCEGLPLGPIKPVGGSLKNKLDRYFLYGKNIEW